MAQRGRRSLRPVRVEVVAGLVDVVGDDVDVGLRGGLGTWRRRRARGRRRRRSGGRCRRWRLGCGARWWRSRSRADRRPGRRRRSGGRGRRPCGPPATAVGSTAVTVPRSLVTSRAVRGRGEGDDPVAGGVAAPVGRSSSGPFRRPSAPSRSRASGLRAATLARRQAYMAVSAPARCRPSRRRPSARGRRRGRGPGGCGRAGVPVDGGRDVDRRGGGRGRGARRGRAWRTFSVRTCTASGGARREPSRRRRGRPRRAGGGRRPGPPSPGPAPPR